MLRQRGRNRTGGAVQPALLLDFLNAPASAASVLTFSRASTATYFDSAGIIQTAASGAARFDYDPVTHAAKGLLIEEARTNLLWPSAAFDDAAWAKSRMTITANAVSAPDGAVTADKMVEDSSASNSHIIAQSTAYTSGLAYTLTVYAKAAERSQLLLLIGGGAFADATPRYCFFNLATAATFGLSGSGATAVITAVGNGWYRCALMFTASATATVPMNIQLCSAGTNIYSGDGTSGLYLWGAQIEAATATIKDTTYTATTTAQATRSADVASVAVTNGSYDVLVQDKSGAEWRDAVTVAAGSYSLTPRSGQRHIARLRLYPAGRLSTTQKTAMQVAV